MNRPLVIGTPGSCGCGHKPCRCCCDDVTVACQLDCPTRPIFYRGQLLKDTHLNALTGWVADRLRLQRFRDGWGVACGLDVQCDPEAPGGVRITPGYAVGCCGDDLVLCEEACLDLTKACIEHTGCADPYARPLGVPVKPLPPCTVGGATIAREELFAIDIVLDPAGQGGCHVLPKGYGCAEATSHDPRPTVIRETARPAWRKAIDEPDAAADFEQRWQACKDIVERLERAKENALEILRQQQPRHFGWLRDIIAGVTPAQLKDFLWGAEILFWLIVDCRLALLDCDCSNCAPEDRVRLARVWLRMTEEKGPRACRVVYINGAAPYRRSLHRACPPAGAGGINFATLAFWQPPAVAQAALAAHGASFISGDPVSPREGFSVLMESAEPFIPLIPSTKAARRLLTVDYPCFGIGTRVIGWAK